MIEVKNISKTFESGPLLVPLKRKKITALKNVSFTLDNKKSLGLAGESGSGKTTLGKILMGFVTPDEGSIDINGNNPLLMKPIHRARLLQMVFQDPYSSLNPKLLVGTQLMEGMRHKAPLERKEAAIRLLESVGLSEDSLERYPHQLSGGQRQRAAIARALSCEPRILIADEPVSNLDLSVQAQIINLLKNLKMSRDLTLIVIAHDLAVLAQLCNELIILKNGEIQEKGSIQEVLTNPQTQVTRDLIRSTPMV